MISGITKSELEVILARLDFERRTLAPEGCTLETLPDVSRLRCPESERHMISFSALTDERADLIIAKEAAHYRRLATQIEWKVYQHDRPADLLQRVERCGFTAGPRETVLVLDLNDRPSWIDEPPSHLVCRIENKDHLELYRQSADEIFGGDHGPTARELLAGIESGSLHHCGYIVIEGKTAVSIGRLCTDPQSAFGGLYGGGTLDRYRNRGFYRATVAARARDAVDLGARYLMVDALPTSRPILERLGFVRLTDTWPCTLEAHRST
ncbi:MAG TPA: hypothetical protein VIX83_02100 [Candidatus Cybelea sp.]